MAKLCGIALGALLLCAWAGTGVAQVRGTGSVRLAMAQAMCTTGPCSPAFNFRGGHVAFKKLKQPKPLVRREIGLLRLDGLYSAGPPLPTDLDGVVTARVNYAAIDPDSDCVAAGSDTTQTIATSSMTCRQRSATTASCRGAVVLVPGVFSDPNCTDVQVFLSDVVVEVFEDDGVGDESKRLARNGALMTGKTPDCDSGGSGCP
jgi:hypothetical protein